VKVEEDAALHFEKMSAAMEECGNHEVAKLFAQLGSFSRLHLAEAQRRAGAIDAAVTVPPDYVWPEHATPERTSFLAGDPHLSRLDALRAALVGEERGYEFYYAVAGTTSNTDIRDLALEFVKEEAEHVAVLKAWITREEWALKTAQVTQLV
jgi:rubrerythrin